MSKYNFLDFHGLQVFKAQLNTLLENFGKSIVYNSQNQMVQLKNGNTVLSQFSASDFIKDGMVSNVEVKDVTINNESVKCLSITFNTDAGKQPINIPLSQIINPNDYYTKQDINSMNLVDSSTLSNNHYTKQQIDNMNLVDSTTLANACYTKQEVDAKLEENELIVASALNNLKADIDIIKQLLQS